jgi:hypothetical protein
VGNWISPGVIGIQSERPGIVLPICTQCDFFKETSRTLRVPDSARSVRGIVASPSKVA